MPKHFGQTQEIYVTKAITLFRADCNGFFAIGKTEKEAKEKLIQFLKDSEEFTREYGQKQYEKYQQKGTKTSQGNS